MNKSFQNRPFIGLSHRGNSKEFIENSLEAFKSVAKKGYKYIETDLRLTLDGHVVTFHDEDLKRLFDLDVKIKNLTLKEVNILFNKHKCELFTFEETLNYFPEIYFNIDLKIKEVVMKTINIVEKTKSFNRVCFASFKSLHTKMVLDKHPEAITSMGLTDVALFKFLKINRKNSNILQIPIKWNGIKILTKKLISDAKKRNLLIHVWTINNPNEMEELIDMGIDGIVTDEPDILMNVIKNRNLLES
ncbi:MAG: hypothetical protein CBD19_02695 [Gammaproteobacteria bacterium TMED159]|nr:MAG: hypothetical protein CBD19_02695 [Gammaproteobacteria bacterium TMED159]